MNNLQTTYLLCHIISPLHSNLSKLKKEIEALDDKGWEKITAVANRYGLIPLLYKSLLYKNLLHSVYDPKLVGYLEAFYKLNEERNIKILQQLEEIISWLDAAGIEVVLLKGAAALSESHYESIGERLMIDIDILVDERDIFRAIDVLKTNGYQELNPTSPLEVEWHHYRRMYKEEHPASLELHRKLLNARAVHYFGTELQKECFIPSSRFQNSLVLLPLYDLYYSFLHTQLSHRYHIYHYLAVRQMQHFSLIATKYGVDIRKIDALAKEHGLLSVWHSYLLLQYKFFHLEVGRDIIENRENLYYLDHIEAKISSSKKAKREIIALIQKIYFSLGYANLRKYYNFESRYCLICYVPLRIVHLLFIYLSSKKKRKKLYNAIKELAS